MNQPNRTIRTAEKNYLKELHTSKLSKISDINFYHKIIKLTKNIGFKMNMSHGMRDTNKYFDLDIDRQYLMMASSGFKALNEGCKYMLIFTGT